MSAIAASTVGVRTMADGTLRLTVDIEPANAKAGFELFGSPGQPVAVAALKTASQAKHEEKPKGGLLSQWAAMRCGEPVFQVWIADQYPEQWRCATGNKIEKAAIVVRALCSIESRAELDSDPAAVARFDQYVRGPWQKFYATQRA